MEYLFYAATGAVGVIVVIELISIIIDVYRDIRGNRE